MYLIFCFCDQTTIAAILTEKDLEILTGASIGRLDAPRKEMEKELNNPESCLYAIVAPNYPFNESELSTMRAAGGELDNVNIIKDVPRVRKIWDRVRRSPGVRSAELKVSEEGVMWSDGTVSTEHISWDAIEQMSDQEQEPVGYTITAELNSEEGIFVHVTIPANDDQVSFILQIGELHKLVSPDEARAFIDLLTKSDYTIEDGPANLSHANGPN